LQDFCFILYLPYLCEGDLEERSNDQLKLIESA
jgi:hypothetical protein